MNENHAPALLPVGFCGACLAAIDAGTFSGRSFNVRGGEMRLVGGYCPHNQVSAVRLEHNTAGEVGPWRMVSPISEDGFLEILRLSGARGDELAAVAVTVNALRRASHH